MGVSERKEKVTQKENKDIDRQTDRVSDDFNKNIKESNNACAREDVEKAYAANQEAYQEYLEALDVMAEDVHSNSDIEQQQAVVNVLRYIGQLVVNSSAVTIHGEKIPTATFLQTLTKAIYAGKDEGLQATIREVAAAMIAGRVKNQSAYLISTIYTRLCAGL